MNQDNGSQSKKKESQIIDYLVLVVKWKKLFITVVVLTAILGYPLIYFLFDEEFEATAVILPAKSEGMTGISSLLKNVKNMSLGGGFPTEMNNELNLYSTIVNSRAVLSKVIAKYKLIEVFGISRSQKDYYERTLKILRKCISTKISEEQVFEINLTMPTPKLAADVTNYIVKLLNDTIVQLEISKSKNNREFLEKRLTDIRNNLRVSEDSLRTYQEKSGMIEAEEQIKGIISAYGKLETELISKQIEYSVYQKLYEEGAPQVENVKIQLKEYEDKINKIKKEGQKDSYLLAIGSLPRKATNYLRHFREVEINSAVLEFLIPLYEQAKFEEQKDVPVLQILDEAVPPAKKSFPPRTIFTLLICFAACVFTFFYILVHENGNWAKSEKIQYVRRNLFKWKEVS